MDVLNLGRILKIEETDQIAKEDLSIDSFLDKSLSLNPLVLEITDQRNALERAMLHFSCYQKKVERLKDSNTYRCTIYYDKRLEESDKYLCSIYYDKRWETELLIQVLSFGPVVKVIGPESFLKQIVDRVKKQSVLLRETHYSLE